MSSLCWCVLVGYTVCDVLCMSVEWLIYYFDLHGDVLKHTGECDWRGIYTSNIFVYNAYAQRKPHNQTPAHTLVRSAKIQAVNAQAAAHSHHRNSYCIRRRSIPHSSLTAVLRPICDKRLVMTYTYIQPSRIQVQVISSYAMHMPSENLTTKPLHTP